MSRVSEAAAIPPTYHGKEAKADLSEINQAPNPEPLSPREKFQDQFPHIVAILRDDDALAVTIAGSFDAEQAALDRNQIDNADNEIEDARNEAHPKSSKAIAAKCEKRRETLKAERTDIRANAERQRAIMPGSTRSYTRDFFNSSAVYGKFTHAETLPDVREGETLMAAMKRQHDAMATLRAEKKELIRAPLPAEEVVVNAHSFVAKLAAPLDQLLGSLRRVTFHEKHGFSPRSANPPTDAKGNVDALGLIAALMPEQLAAALAAKALDLHDESSALDDATRQEKLNAIEAEMLRLQYVSEAIHRLSRKTGENAGPRLTSNPLAILDLIPA